MGEERSAPGGVLDHGTREEDDPGTWETLAFLDRVPEPAENPVTRSPTPARKRAVRMAIKKSVRIEVGRWQGKPEPRPTRRGSRRAAK